LINICQYIHEAISIYKIKPKKEQLERFVKFSIKAGNSVASEDSLARLKCSLDWLQKALQYATDAKNVSQINQIIISYLEISKEFFGNSTPTVLIDFGLELSKYVPSKIDESHLEWLIFFPMLMAYLIIVNYKSSESKDEELKGQILTGSNLARNHPSARSIYMKYLVQITQTSTRSEYIYVDDSKLDLLKQIFPTKNKSMEFKEILNNLKKMILNQKKMKPNEIYVDPIYLLLELTRHSLSNNCIDDARDSLHLIETTRYTNLSLDIDLSIKYCKEEYYLRTKQKIDKIKIFERLSKIIYQASKSNCHQVVLECSVAYWNMISSHLTEKQTPALIRTFELILKSLESVPEYYELNLELNYLLKYEISRFYDYEHYLTRSSFNAPTETPDVTNFSIEKGN
jgi:hypothetical protein